MPRWFWRIFRCFCKHEKYRYQLGSSLYVECVKCGKPGVSHAVDVYDWINLKP